MQEVGYNPQHPNSKPWIDLVLDFREISASNVYTNCIFFQPDTKSSSANGDRSAQEVALYHLFDSVSNCQCPRLTLRERAREIKERETVGERERERGRIGRE
eukprot:1345858-Amorphochlora_amoeboformis.AAC.1